MIGYHQQRTARRLDTLRGSPEWGGAGWNSWQLASEHCRLTETAGYTSVTAVNARGEVVERCAQARAALPFSTVVGCRP